MSASTFSVFTETQNWFEANNIIFHSQPVVESTNNLAKEEAFALSSSLKCYLAERESFDRDPPPTH